MQPNRKENPLKMDRELQKAVRLGVIFGLIGAAGIPLCYEIYANLGRSFGWFFLLGGAVAAGIKLSSFNPKNAALGFAVMLPVELGFGLAAFMVIHPAVVSFLESHSKYFYLAPAQTFKFILGAAAMQLAAPGVALVRAGAEKAVKKLKENGEAAGRYIENAFDDSSDNERNF